jgi:hypothetical protein
VKSSSHEHTLSTADTELYEGEQREIPTTPAVMAAAFMLAQSGFAQRHEIGLTLGASKLWLPVFAASAPKFRSSIVMRGGQSFEVAGNLAVRGIDKPAKVLVMLTTAKALCSLSAAKASCGLPRME